MVGSGSGQREVSGKLATKNSDVFSGPKQANQIKGEVSVFRLCNHPESINQSTNRFQYANSIQCFVLCFDTRKRCWISFSCSKDFYMGRVRIRSDGLKALSRPKNEMSNDTRLK
jgi:hypothetical protein